MSNAVDKFQHGQRVRLTEAGRSLYRNVARKDRLGTVVGFGYQPHVVGVVPDGTKTRHSFHMDFWEPLPATPELQHD